MKMRKGKLYFGRFFVFVVMVFFLLPVEAIELKEGKRNEIFEADVVIDSIKKLRSLQRPPVVFPHDRHTDSLSKVGKNCSCCHMMDSESRSFKFKRLVDLNYEVVMQNYHDNCIGCHKEMLSKGESVTGPTKCGNCHSFDKIECKISRKPVRFDKYLHYRHVEANSEKCVLCHHGYDEKDEKRIYKKGDENPCSYCHGQTKFKKAKSLSDVLHLSCIGCHLDNKESKRSKNGPYKCIGCHGLSMQAVEVENEQNVVKRMNRGQPNTVFISNGCNKSESKTSGLGCMKLVLFDHELHEKGADSCIVCHHSSLESCSKCHTNVGGIETKYVNLADAMHSTELRSCIGCHSSKQKAAECYGCHSLVNKKDQNCVSNFVCDSCHLISPSEKLIDFSSNKSNINSVTSNLLKEHRNNFVKSNLYDEEKIPKEVTINKLENKYKPVVFPHRKVVLSLSKRIKNSKLAEYFHSDEGILCLGCHHNSPISEKPPACGNCHGEKVIASIPFKPDILSAYHQQCIGCHTEMKLKKPDLKDCGSCHELKDCVK